MAKDTKQKIIAFTLQEIAAGNYSELSLRKLSKKIGLTTGAFYKHFSNKDQLLGIAAKELNNDLVQEIRQSGVLKKSTPEGSLIALGKFLMIKTEKDTELMNFLFFETESTYETLADTSPLFKLTTDIIAEILSKRKSGEKVETVFYREWSFILGYGLLIKNKVTTYNNDLFEQTVLTLLNEESL